MRDGDGGLRSGSLRERAGEGSGAAPALGGASIARLRKLIYALAVLSSVLQSAIAPLLPSYAHRFDLDGLETASLIAATGVAALVISLPAGALSDRFGARVLTLWAGWLAVIATLGQALAPNFGWLVASRFVFGLGYGIIWTAALTWLARASGDESCLAGTITASGVGCIAGPAFAGWLAQSLGLAAPLLIAAGSTAAVTVMLTALDCDPAPCGEQAGGVLGALSTAVGDRRVLGAGVAVALAGASAALVTLLGPLELHDSGLSAGAIGVVFSMAAALFIIGSALTKHAGARVVRLRTVLVAGLVLAALFTPGSASTAPFFVILVLCATAAARSVLWAVAYPLGADGAHRAGAGLGVVMGLLNLVWAIASVLSPLVAGVLVGTLGARATFAVAEVFIGGLLAAVWAAFRMRVPLHDLRGQRV